MSCLRCGRETSENQVFCQSCLTVMESQPVKPDTPIQLPNRDSRVLQKRANHKTTASRWADRLFRLRFTIFLLCMRILVLVVLLLIALGVLFQWTPQWLNDLLFSGVTYEIVAKTP